MTEIVPLSTGPARWKKNFLKGTLQCFCSQRKFYQILALLAHSLKLVNKSSHMTQVLFKLLPLCWEQVNLCVNLLRAESWFPTALWLFWLQVLLVFKPDVMAACLPSARPPGWGAQCGACTPCSSGGTSAVVMSLLLLCHCTGGVGSD